MDWRGITRTGCPAQGPGIDAACRTDAITPCALGDPVEVAERFGPAAREAAICNLKRQPVVLSLFGDLMESG